MVNKELPAIWHDQRNNEVAPYGTCNATTVAMIMQYLGMKGTWNEQGQLDDWVTRRLDQPDAWDEHKRTLPSDWQTCNPRNNPYVLKWLLGLLGIKDDLRIGVKWNTWLIVEIKASIDKGMPVICSGFYARKKASGIIDTIGHINAIVGYNDTEFIFNDPFGDMNKLYVPYPNDGDHVHYSIEKCKKAITQVHILSKGVV